jgi:hypothetical protein
MNYIFIKIQIFLNKYIFQDIIIKRDNLKFFQKVKKLILYLIYFLYKKIDQNFISLIGIFIITKSKYFNLL